MPLASLTPDVHSTRAETRRAKARFLESHVMPDGIVDDAIARSWERSRALGLRPEDKTLFRNMASLAEGRVIAERARHLLAAVTPELERIAADLTHSRMSVICTDAEGVIVDTLCHAATAPRELRDALRVGRALTEAEFGTTAPGCVLAEHTAQTVMGEEHFLAEVSRFLCAAAPIFQFDGTLIGVLDVTGIDVRFDAALKGLVEVAARAAEHRLFAAVAPGSHLRVHHDPRFLRTPLVRMLAVDDEGRVLGACHSARQTWNVGGVLDGSPRFLHELLDVDLDSLRRRLQASEVAEVRAPNGGKLYVTLDRQKKEDAPARIRSVAGLADTPSQGSSVTRAFVADPRLEAATRRALLAFRRGVPVLLRGETGTGKDVLARTLHETYRAGGPFVAINCSAIPEALIEAELFGYADGSFTGARKAGRVGKIAHADRGTLFLDEIGDMDVRLQPRLLHFLQTGLVSRLGESVDVRVDCSVVCATHRDLEAMVEAGQFREDLYHRVNGLSVELPALRDRTDFEGLLEFFLAREGGRGQRIADDVRARLSRHAWRGNVRELEQVIRTAVALADGASEIGMDHLPSHFLRTPSSSYVHSGNEKCPSSLDRATTEIVRKALAAHGGNVSAAARALGISRGTLYKKSRAPS